MLHIDIETYSGANLPECGLYRYAQDPSTRLLLVAYAYDEAAVQLVDVEHGEQLPQQLLDDLTNPEVLKCAHNAEFERVLLSALLGIECPPEQWRCTMVMAGTVSLPRGLESLSKALKLGQSSKIKDGKRLIARYCKPSIQSTALDHDHDWQAFREYCRQDVVAERKVADRLSRYPVPVEEWSVWAVDQRINGRGLPIDLSLAHRILLLATDHRESTLRDASSMTGLANPGSTQQMIAWLAERGIQVEDLQASTVEQLLRGDIDDAVRSALEARQQLSRSSLAKLDALDRACCEDGRMRGAFVYHGAGTGRWTGRLFQPQNLPRPTISADEIDQARVHARTLDADTFAMLYDDVSGTLASCIRSLIAAPDGRQLVVADYASIESVMIAWCCQSEYLLDLYREGLDPYKDFATKVYGVAYEDVTKAQRSFCKPAVLGAAYGLGAAGLQRYAEAFGMVMGADDAKHQIDLFRQSYSAIPEFWQQLDDGTAEAMRTSNKPVTVGRFVMMFDKRFFTIRLPSGRRLYYYQPRMETDDYGRGRLTYAGREPGSRTSTRGPKIVENVVQAVARDLLAHGLVQAEQRGLQVVGHVHDEIICECNADDSTALDRLIAAMTDLPDWCADAPVRAEGYSANYYRKD